MGNIGRSSTGCALCRRRKIKCDEGRPGCLKCAKIRKPCPGYPFQIEINLNIEATESQHLQAVKQESPLSDGNTNKVVLLAAKPDKFAQSQVYHITSNVVVKHESQSHSSTTVYAIPEHHPQPAPRYDIQHQSICYFLHLFCFQAGRIYSFPVLDFLPDMVKSSSKDSCLHYATTAVSRMTLADQYSGHDRRLRTGKEYGQALMATNTTIRDSAENIKDETVVAVWLLGLYEHVNAVLTHGRTQMTPKSVEEEWQSHVSHIRGALNLLRLRGKSQFKTARGEKVFRVLKAAIQMRLFILNSVTSKDFEDLEQDVYQDEHEFVPSETANKATSYFLRVARLQETIKFFLTKPRGLEDAEAIRTEALQLIRKGEDYDQSMDGWSKDEPGWDMMKVRANTTGTMWALYPSHAIYHFYSFWVFLYWIRFLIARVKLYEALIELLKIDLEMKTLMTKRSYDVKSDPRLFRYRTIIQMTAGELIGLTAYAIGDVTCTGAFHSAQSGSNPGRNFQEMNVVAAMQLVIPLKSLQRSIYPTPIQKGAIDLAISHIGDGFRRQPLYF